MRARMPLDPALRAYLDQTTPPAPAAAPITDLQRAATGRALMLDALRDREAIPGLPNAVSSQDLRLREGLRARLYRPPLASGPMPLLVYLHGGGWVVGSVETHDPFCRLLCQAARLCILSVDYRLAPEHPYPAAVEDALAAIEQAHAQADHWEVDAGRMAVGGDSAGANLAAVAANTLNARGTGGLCAQLLLYPVTDHPSQAHASYESNGSGYGLDAKLLRWFWSVYAPEAFVGDPGVAPLRCPSLGGLPPTYVATAEYDPLRDEGMAYVQHLRAAGVDVTHAHAPDMHHNFAVHPGTVARFPQSVQALEHIAAWLRERMG